MATSHMSGPLAVARTLTVGGATPMTANAPSFALSMPNGTITVIAAASGTIPFAWRATLPGYATKLWEIGASFPKGGTGLPQGGTVRLKVWSNGATKGLFAGSVAGATVENLRLTLTGGATFPAGADLGVSVHTAGATTAGRSPRLTLYMSYV